MYQEARLNAEHIAEQAARLMGDERGAASLTG
jgi:hypothetical protein